ncbi:MFS general substrate transporter [Cystobasidium minutum MCA 4210]|uniref:MFS general substrate transporter n=1 Tax=Cystobasidium minutum MCA 4210 TaxID=1397322 RepID=UPI0034CDA665|eukprot:jgi/Rhomi1/160020/estExt_Genewise1Plus.C_3_t30361
MDTTLEKNDRRELEGDLATPTKEVSAFIQPYTEEQERKVLRKIDFTILPVLAFTYGLQFLDKQALSKAAVIGLVKDTKLVGQDYPLLTTIFYIGMIAFEWPVNVGLQKLPSGKFAAVMVICWGVSLSCMAGSHNFGALAACRFFLGGFEATIGPALMLVTTTWYKRREHSLRVGLWYSFQGLAISIGGLLAYGVQKWGGPLRAWQSLFLFTGILTVAWGFALLVLLPDSIDKAFFFTPEEKLIAKQRLQNERTTSAEKRWRWDHVKEALTSVNFWLTALFSFSANWITSMNAFAGLIIKGFGFSNLRTVLLNIPSGVFNVFAILTFSYIGTRYKNKRCFCMAFAYLVGIAGALMLLYVPTSQPWARLGAVWLTAVAPSGFTISLSLATSNTMGSTKKTFTNASVFLGFAVGNLVSPQLYFDSEAPSYRTGAIGVLSFSIVACVTALCMYAYLRHQNAVRDKLALSNPAADPSIPPELDEDEDRTDMQDLKFRYMM